MHTKLQALLVSCLFCLAGACASQQPSETVEPEGPGGAPERGTEVLSNAGRYRVLYFPVPDPIPSGEVFSMLVWVFDAESGAELTEPLLVVDAGMPHHQHGMNIQPVQSRMVNGPTLVDGLLFHMPGAWTVTFDIEQGGVTERAQVVLDVD